MRLPRIFRTTPFRLTLLFLALFASAASAFLAYIYVATAGEATRRTDLQINREMRSLIAAYDRAGLDAVNQSLIERASSERPFLYLLMTEDGRRISQPPRQAPLGESHADGVRRLFRESSGGHPVRRSENCPSRYAPTASGARRAANTRCVCALIACHRTSSIS